MRRLIFAFAALSLLACSEDPATDPSPPSCPAASYLSSVVDPLRERLEAAGKELVDCSGEDVVASTDCIAGARAAGNGFVAVWGGAAEVELAYVGSDEAVLRFERRSPFDQPWEQYTEVCESFTAVAGCTDGRQSWCHTCVTGEAKPTYLCKDAD